MALAATVLVAPPTIPSARAATWEVPGDYPTIAAAIADAAVLDGDTIFVNGGTFTDNLVFDKNLTVVSEPATTLVDVTGSGASAVTVDLGKTVTLNGIQITGGGGFQGGGIANNGTLNLVLSEVYANNTSGPGGGIYSNGITNVDRSVIRNNSTAGSGGGVFVASGTFGAISTSIHQNSNSDSGPAGGMAVAGGASADLTNVTIAFNGSYADGGGIDAGGTVTIRNTVIARNSVAEFAGSTETDCVGTIISAGNNLIGELTAGCNFTPISGDLTGTGELPLDPLFDGTDDANTYEFILTRSDSPLVDGGDNTGLNGLFDVTGETSRTVDGTANGTATADIGALELDPITVCPGQGNCDHETFASALGAGFSDAIIRLAPGDYTDVDLTLSVSVDIQGSGTATTLLSASSDTNPATPRDSTTRVARVDSGAVVAFRDLTIMSGDPVGDVAGGGLFATGPSTEVEATRVRFTDNNTGDTGGAIGLANGSFLELDQSTVDGNTADEGGGGMAAYATFTVQRSTFLNNSTLNGPGGAILVGIPTFSDIFNSTITGNSALGAGGIGGGVAVQSVGSNVVASHSTIWDNEAAVSGHGVEVANGSFALYSSILAEPPGDDVCDGTIEMDGYSLVSNTDDCTVVENSGPNQTGTTGFELDPLLDALADNGGPTLTLALLSGSPAIDNGEPPGSESSCEGVDQRGAPRLDGIACDVGSYEGFIAPFDLQDAIDNADVGDTINIPAGTFVENALVGIDLSFVGTGIPTTIIDGGGTGCVFQIENGADVEFSSMTIRDGDCSTGGGISFTTLGNLEVSNVAFTGNNASVNGGGAIASTGNVILSNATFVSNTAPSSVADGVGGAIWHAGADTDLDISNSSFTANSSYGNGGAISADNFLGNLTITNTTFQNNSVSGPGSAGGALHINGAVSDVSATFTTNTASSGSGGAIWADGSSLTLNPAVFTGNSADESGAIHATGGSVLDIDNSTFTGNNSSSFAGAIHATSSDITLSDTQLTMNTSSIRGGAIDIASGDLTIDGESLLEDNEVFDGPGGAVSFDGDGQLRIDDATFRLNTAIESGGAILVGNSPSATRDVDIDNATFDQNDAGGAGAIFIDAPTSSIDTSDFSDNDASDAGAIWLDTGTLTIGSGTSLSGNSALETYGGAIGTAFGTTLSIEDAIVGPGNFAAFSGGGIYSEGVVNLSASTVSANGTDGDGGGIFASGPLNIVDSTIEGNLAVGGGAIYTTDLDLRNSTVSSNDASGQGGGLHIVAGGSVDINNATVAFNTADEGGGVFKATTIPAAGNLSNTIVANNSASTGALGHDCSLEAGSGFVDGGFNLISRGDVPNGGEGPPEACGISDGGGNIIGFYDPGLDVDAMLDALEVNGAVTTETHALLAGSPAIDAGNTFGLPPCEATSQNGVVRPQGSECDIGAFEVDLAGLPSLIVDVSVLSPTIQPGLSSIPTEEIGTDALADPTGKSASEVASNQEVGDIQESPIANIPIANIPIANIFIADAPVNDIAAALLGDLLLIDIPVDFTGGWPALVGPALGGPIQQYTLADAFNDPTTKANIEAADLSFAELGLASTPIASLSPVALALGSTPIANIPLNNETDPQLILEAWCALLAGTPAGCPVLGVNPADPSTADEVNIFSLALAEAPIANLPIANIPVANIPVANIPVANIPVANIPVANIPVANIPVANIPIANIPVANIALAATPVANIPVANIPVANLEIVLDCVAADCINLPPGTTLGDIDPALWTGSFGELLKILIDAGELNGNTLDELVPGLPPDATLGDLIAFLLPPADQPWQEVDLLAIELTSATGAGVTTVSYQATFTASNIGAADTVEVAMVMPPDVQYVPGSGEFDLDGFIVAVEPTVFDDVFVFDLVNGGIEGTPVLLSFDATAPLKLGPLEVISSVDIPDVVNDFGSVNQFVEEAFEPNNTPPTATPIEEDTLYVTHIGSKGDRDFFRLSGVQAGSEISVILANLPADYDIVLYGPEAVTLRGAPEKVAAGVRDPDVQLLETGEVQAELVHDILLENLDIVGVSANRGTADEEIATGPVPRTGNYFIQVTGYNGSKSALPYTLRARVAAPGGLGACAATGVLGGVPGVLPGSLPAGVNTLLLWNKQRYEAVHGPAAAVQAQQLMEQVASASSLGVNGAVIPVEGAAPVATAYGNWNADPCSVDAANAVANSVAQLVDGYRDSNPTIQYVVIVGSDEQIPQFRIYDTTTIANESTYSTSVSTQLNEITAALAGSFYFSDDPYGDKNPVITRAGQEIYVPNVALGRLVESHTDIATSLQNFLAFNGLLDPQTVASAYVTGYDFLIDGAQAVSAGLSASGHTVLEAINDNWNRQDLANGLLSGTISLASPNAHYDHYRAEPADSTLGLFENTDVDAAGPAVMRRAVVWTMGCHSALSVSDIQIGGGPLADDWAETYAGQGAGGYIGNTGFGYGETETVALSEELMAFYAENLTGLMTSGQALQFAKHRYAAGELLYGSYDQKSLMEATFFGMPMFRIGGGGIIPPAPPVIPTFVDGQTGLVAGTVDLNLAAGDFELTTRPRGDFYSVDGKQQVTPFRPVQPKVEIDVTQPSGLVAKGAVITGLSSTDFPNFDPVVARPTVDLAANEPEPRDTSIFPTQLQTVNRYLDLAGFRDQLVIVPGQFRHVANGLGVQRLFGDISATVYYGPAEGTDFEPPVILRAEGFDDGGSNQVNFRIETRDEGGFDNVVRVLVLFKSAGAPAWTPLDLAYQGNGVWLGAADSAGGLQDFFVQAVDGAGNVGVTQKKGEFFQTQAPPPLPGYVTVTGSSVNGWFQSPVIVEVVGDQGVGFGYNLDGEGFVQYMDPFQIAGEGLHVVDVIGSDGTDDLFTVRIDDTPPTVVSPVQGAVIPVGAVRPAFFGCTDAGSGVDTCTSPAQGTNLDTSTPGVFSFTVAATDNVGLSTNVDVIYEVVDRPTATIEGVPPGFVAEGSVLNLSGVTDAINPTYGWRLLRDGGVVDSAVGDSVSFPVPDDGNYEIRLKVFANGIESDVATAAFTADNVDPILLFAGDEFGDVGIPVLLEFSEVDDPGDDSVFEIVVDWGDGALDTYDSLGTAAHVYFDEGLYDISIDYADEDGAYGVDWQIEIGAGQPTITVDQLSVSVLEGEEVFNGGTYSGSEPVDIFADVGDVDFLNGTWTWTSSTSDGPDETQTVIVTIEDAVGFNETAFELIVNNVAPAAEVSGPPTGLVGVPYQLEIGAIQDPGDDTVTLWTIDWGDGSEDSFATDPGSANHEYAESGTYDIVLTVDDEDGPFEAGGTVVVVDDLAAPTIAVDASDVAVSEGSIATNSGTFTGTGGVTVSATEGVVTTADGTWSWSYISSDGPEDSTTITVTVQDDVGEASVDFELTVENVMPDADLSGSASAIVDAPYPVTVGDAVDPGDDTVTTYVIDWGDGSTEDEFPTAGVYEHTFSAIGQYTVTLDLIDEDGTYGSVAELVVNVVEGSLSCATAVPTITGTSGNDIVFGTNGDDVIFTFGGHDLVFAKNGNDIICTAGGNDIVYAGGGDDLVESGAGKDIVHGGLGADILNGDADADKLYGGSSDDTLLGGPGNDKMYGWTGDDTFDGGEGNDKMYGEFDDDLFIDSEGNDRMWGAFGNDTVSYENAPNGVNINLGNGNIAGQGNDKAILIENAIGSEFADSIKGTPFRNLLYGLGGADTIRGKNGADDIFGGAGDDFLRGQGGNDFLDGGSGFDWLHGGPGVDECRNGETVISCNIL